jgi:two-component system invasion response regulator UvrY
MDTTTSQEITIAIADDNPIFRIGLGKMLSSFPDCMVVLEDDDCNTLLRNIGKMPVAPQLCVIDMSMSGAYQMLKDARQQLPDMKILVLTALCSELNIIRTIKIGVNGFLLKGCDEQELHTAIRSINQHGSYFAEGSPIEAAGRESVLLELNYEELEILSLCCTEMPVAAIAAEMNITTRAAEAFIAGLCDRLAVRSRIGLVLFALNMGLKPKMKLA